MTDLDADSLRTRLNLLFSQYSEADIQFEISVCADFFAYLGSEVVSREGLFHIPHDILSSFESVYLLLCDRLVLYPDSILKQVQDIANKRDLCGQFAQIAALWHPDNHILYRSSSVIHELFRALRMFSIPFIRDDALPGDPRDCLRRENLFAIRTDILRITQILRYAASLRLPGTDGRDFREHYDPDLVDKFKILALVNLLRSDIDTIEDGQKKQLLQERLAELEVELRKPRSIRWGFVLTTLFILLGCLADLKTLKPDIYDRPHALTHKIIETIYAEGQVHRKDVPSLTLGNCLPPLLPHTPVENTPPPPQAVMSNGVVIRPKEDEAN